MSIFTILLHTSLKEVDVLNRAAFVVLRVAPLGDVAIVTVVKPVIKAPDVIKSHKATLPVSPLLTGLLLPAPPPPRGRGGGFGSEVDSSHQGGVYGGPDAVPVPADVTWPRVVAAH